MGASSAGAMDILISERVELNKAIADKDAEIKKLFERQPPLDVAHLTVQVGVLQEQYKCLQDRMSKVVEQLAAAAAAQPPAAAPGPTQQGAGSSGLHFPPSKKVRIESTPSALQPKYVDSYGYIPHDGYDRREVAYYTGRHNAAPLNIAPPVLLCVPEFGLVYDALLADPQFMVAAGPRVFQAAHELCEHMARVYSREKDRQQAFVQWYNKYMATPGILIPSKSSASASNTGENDGAVTVEVGGHQYSPLVFEVKNEMGAAGDPMFQTLGYYQHLYLNGERWDREPVLRASGAPALLFELVGPNLCISGVYTLEGNVVTKEPLTPWIPLLPLGGRMEAHVVQLARVLAAVQSAVRLLECRLRMMATGQEAPAAGPPAALTPWDLAAQLLASSTPNRALQLLQAALREATLTGSAQAAAAAMPAAAAAGQGGPASWPRSRERPWTRLPYPLATSQDFTQVAALPGLT